MTAKRQRISLFGKEERNYKSSTKNKTDPNQINKDEYCVRVRIKIRSKPVGQ